MASESNWAAISGKSDARLLVTEACLPAQHRQPCPFKYRLRGEASSGGPAQGDRPTRPSWSMWQPRDRAWRRWRGRRIVLPTRETNAGDCWSRTLPGWRTRGIVSAASCGSKRMRARNGSAPCRRRRTVAWAGRLRRPSGYPGSACSPTARRCPGTGPPMNYTCCSSRGSSPRPGPTPSTHGLAGTSSGPACRTPG